MKTMFIATVVSGNVVTIKLDGRFTFAAHADFRKVSQETIAGSCKAIEIDFAKVESLDSAAQGMLLLAREGATRVEKTISFVNCKGEAKQILEMSGFKRLFSFR